MSSADLARLLGGISAQHVYAFFLVLARISPLFLVAPVFSSQMLIPRVRSVLAVALAFGLTPLVEHGHTIQTGVFPFTGLLVENFLVGFALAFTLACVFAAIQGAGVFADAFGGFSFGEMADPISGNPGGSMTNLYTIVGLAMFLVIGGDAWTVRGIDMTFTAVPITAGAQTGPLVAQAQSALVAMFLGALEIAAPVMLAVFVTDIAFGLVSKVVPQLSVFSIGFTVKVGVALLIVGVSLPFMGAWLDNQIQSSLGTALQTLHVT